MPNLTYDFDWMDAPGVRGPELAATWARLSVRADGHCITRVLDERAQTIRNYVYVPLYPLAEWLTTNWWFLTSECANPDKENATDFYRRHALGPHREGYAYPNLKIVPHDARTQISWDLSPPQWCKTSFLEAGNAWVDSAEFQAVGSALIDQVIRRLEAHGIDDTLLQDEWAAIQAADADETQFCRTAAGLGWDPYDLDENRQQTIFQLGESLGSLLDEAIPALNGDNPDADSRIIVSTIAATKQSHGIPLASLHPVRDAVRDGNGNGSNPWTTGYDWARRLRQRLQLNGDPLPDLAQIADALGEPSALVDRVMAPMLAGVGMGAALIDGVITQDYSGAPAFGMRRIHDQGRTFLFCRALAEVLASPTENALLTRAYSARQQRNRAFAAEFLAPSAQLRQMMPRSVLDSDDIDEMAAHFGVSAQVIGHQIENHRIGRILR